VSPELHRNFIHGRVDAMNDRCSDILSGHDNMLLPGVILSEYSIILRLSRRLVLKVLSTDRSVALYTERKLTAGTLSRLYPNISNGIGSEEMAHKALTTERFA
jgi:hypothetical protein